MTSCFVDSSCENVIALYENIKSFSTETCKMKPEYVAVEIGGALAWASYMELKGKVPLFHCKIDLGT